MVRDVMQEYYGTRKLGEFLRYSPLKLVPNYRIINLNVSLILQFISVCVRSPSTHSPYVQSRD